MALEYPELRLIFLEQDEDEYTLTEDSFYRNVWGNEGSDTIEGNVFDNVLDGGTGADFLIGGAGNDTYRIDDPEDSIIEEVGSGTDTVVTTIGFDLDEILNVENVLLVGVADVDAYGDHLNNTISGNAGVNYIDGRSGNDRLSGGDGADILVGGKGDDLLNGGTGEDAMAGGEGDDTYYVDAAGDEVMEAFGGGTADRVNTIVDYALGSDVERLCASGSGSISLTGNGLANTILGNNGSNKINGEWGKDALKGGGGKDTFIFDTKLSSSNADKIIDYSVASDTIWLDDAIFKKLDSGSEASPKKLSSSYFTIGSAAKDKNDYLIYNNKTGCLYYDADGSGSGKAVLVATLSEKLKMTCNDFYVI